MAGALAACGDSDSDSSTSKEASSQPSSKSSEGKSGSKSTQDGGSQSQQGDESADLPSSDDSESVEGSGGGNSSGDSGSGGSGSGHVKGGDSGGSGSAQGNSTQDFSSDEDNASERARATAAIEGFLDARGTDLTEACTYMSASLRRAYDNGEGGCPGTLEKFSSGISASETHATSPASTVFALRVQGDEIVAFYQGLGGDDYFMPMAKEGSEWKVALITPQLSS